MLSCPPDYYVIQTVQNLGHIPAVQEDYSATANICNGAKVEVSACSFSLYPWLHSVGGAQKGFPREQPAAVLQRSYAKAIFLQQEAGFESILYILSPLLIRKTLEQTWECFLATLTALFPLLLYYANTLALTWKSD